MLDADARIDPHIRRTPIRTSDHQDELTGAQLFLKCENFQEAGVFKVRCATNAVFGMSEALAAKGVATHSSGNHALSLAWAAGRRGIPCHVVMPRTVPKAKTRPQRSHNVATNEQQVSMTATSWPRMGAIPPSITRPRLIALENGAVREAACLWQPHFNPGYPFEALPPERPLTVDAAIQTQQLNVRDQSLLPCRMTASGCGPSASAGFAASFSGGIHGGTNRNTENNCQQKQ